MGTLRMGYVLCSAILGPLVGILLHPTSGGVSVARHDDRYDNVGNKHNCEFSQTVDGSKVSLILRIACAGLSGPEEPRIGAYVRQWEPKSIALARSFASTLFARPRGPVVPCDGDERHNQIETSSY